MLFGETVAVYCENHTEHTDTLCGQNAEFWYVVAGGTYSNHWTLKGYIQNIYSWLNSEDRAYTPELPVYFSFVGGTAPS
jgi:hypothetical protein